MATYEKAEPAIAEHVAAVMVRYHGALDDAGVRIDTLMVHARRDAYGDPVGAALKLRGVPCMATIRVIGLKDRAAGRGDAEMLLDGDRWDQLGEAEQTAVLDHELTHLELHVGEGGVKRDDLGRPRLRRREHDHTFGWFDEIVRRHGRSSIEWQQWEHFEEVGYRQLWLPFVDETSAR